MWEPISSGPVVANAGRNMTPYENRKCQITKRLAEDMLKSVNKIYADTTIQKVIKDSARRAGIKKRVDPHVLRHIDAAGVFGMRRWEQLLLFDLPPPDGYLINSF
jgi:site-specific recombinase XerC